MHVFKDQPIKMKRSAPNNWNKKCPVIHSQVQVSLFNNFRSAKSLISLLRQWRKSACVKVTKMCNLKSLRFASCCIFILCRLKFHVRARTSCRILQSQTTTNVGWQFSRLLSLLALLITKCSSCKTVLNNLKRNFTMHENYKQTQPVVTVLFRCTLANDKLYIYLKVAN